MLWGPAGLVTPGGPLPHDGANQVVEIMLRSHTVENTLPVNHMMEKTMRESRTMERPCRTHDGENHAGECRNGTDHAGEIMPESPTMEKTGRKAP